MESNLYLGLVHHPIYDKRGEVVATAVTNFDIHDIARCARTFGLERFLYHYPLREPDSVSEEDHSSLDRRFRSEFTIPRERNLYHLFGSLGPSKRRVEKSQIFGRESEESCRQGHRIIPEVLTSGRLRKLLEDRDTPFLILFGTRLGFDTGGEG